MAEKKVDEISGVETTGHDWDGITELDNPMPRWWLWAFYACILWAVGYATLYPSIPLINGSTAGLLGYSSRADVATEMTAAKAAQAKYLTKISSMSLSDISKDPELHEFAVAGGASAFKVHCVQCHGHDGSGSSGYPNLNDDDWLWGGKLEDIHTTIQHGIRSDKDDDTRVSDMPAFGFDEILERPQINDVAEYVLKLSNTKHDEKAATRGAVVFADNCVACHGEKGTGDQSLGAPNLSDAVSLFGNTREHIRKQVTRPAHNVMPAWSKSLSETTIKQLVLYVYSKGGGQ